MQRGIAYTHQWSRYRCLNVCCIVVGVVNVGGASIVDHRVVGVPVVTLPRLFLAQHSFRVRPVIQIVEALKKD